MANAARKTATTTAEKQEESQEKSPIDFSGLSTFETVKATVLDIPEVIKSWVEDAYTVCKAEPQTFARAVLASEDAVNEAEKLARKYADSRGLKLRRQSKGIPGNVFMARLTDKSAKSSESDSEPDTASE